MQALRTTAEIKCEDLAGLLATERITARMPAVTLEKLTMEMAPIVVEPAPEPVIAAPPYARGGTALPEPKPSLQRLAIVAISAALTVITALGIAATF